MLSSIHKQGERKAHQGLTMKRKIPLIALSILLVVILGLAIVSANTKQTMQLKDIKIDSKQVKLQKLQIEYKQLNSELEQTKKDDTVDASKLKEYEERIRQMDEDYKKLETSKREEKSRLAQLAAALEPKASAAAGCGDNNLAYEIYKHESNCRLDAINSIGCIGIGQNCPSANGTVQLAIDCPNWRSDYACQNAWFTRYAMAYGSWEAAHAFKFCVGNCYSTRTKITVYKPASNKWW